MKDDRILVDTSAWIVSFKKRDVEELRGFLRDAIDKDQVVTAPFIILELLQGCRTQAEFEVLKTRLAGLETFALENLDYENLYLFGFLLRKKGLTLSTLDILIAFICIKNNCTLLHHDHHFRMIAKQSELKAIDFL